MYYFLQPQIQNSPQNDDAAAGLASQNKEPVNGTPYSAPLSSMDSNSSGNVSVPGTNNNWRLDDESSSQENNKLSLHKVSREFSSKSNTDAKDYTVENEQENGPISGSSVHVQEHSNDNKTIHQIQPPASTLVGMNNQQIFSAANSNESIGGFSEGKLNEGPEQRQNQEHGRKSHYSITDEYEWQFFDENNQWVNFEQLKKNRKKQGITLSQEIEQQYNENPSRVFKLDIDEDRYRIVFGKKRMTNMRNGSAKAVRRVRVTVVRPGQSPDLETAEISNKRNNLDESVREGNNESNKRNNLDESVREGNNEHCINREESAVSIVLKLL